MQRAPIHPRRQVRWTGQPLADDAVRVRRELEVVLGRWGVAPETAEDAVLVAAELMANAVVHAGTPFVLTARLGGPILRVAVRDDRPGPGPPRAPQPGAGRATGLRLVSAIALRWGWEQHAAGKTVWAEFVT